MTGHPPDTPDPNIGRASGAGAQPGYGPPDQPYYTPAGEGATPAAPTSTGGGEGNAVAIVSLVLAIVGIVTGLFTGGVLGILLGIVAIVLGVLGRRKVKQGRTTEHGGIALAGLITGVVSVIIGLTILVFLIAILGSVFTNPDFQRALEEGQRIQEQQQE